MNRFLKGVMKNCNHGIDRWDEPSVRTRPDGTKVVGRPTRGFGSGGTFTYAGKEYKPEPWTGFMFLVKCEAEDIVEDALAIVLTLHSVWLGYTRQVTTVFHITQILYQQRMT